jgi:probable phosphoglycerate mutase
MRFGRRRLYLMRHGRVDYFSDRVLAAGDHRIATLTEEGKAQALAAGEALSGVVFDLALSSGLARTQETAELVLSRNPAAPELGEDGAFEELRGGTLKFPSREEAAAAMQGQFQRAHHPGAAMFGGERFLEAQGRAVTALEALATGPIWRTALIVAHEGINRLILSWACGAGLAAAPAFEQDTGCINVLDLDVGPDEPRGARIERVIVKTVNVTPYNWLKHGMSRTSLEAIFAAD